jgi:spore photoproduct lyase
LKKVIYIEKGIKDAPRTKSILKKFKNPIIIIIDRYSEVFNKKNQNFRLQKKNPAIIIAKKHKNFLLETPSTYSIGRRNNYYFSYMYNCLFDCRYCFLQGMYNSANFVIFINYEDFFNEVRGLDKSEIAKDTTIFTGYDCDSLAYDNITNFSSFLLGYLSEFNDIEIEIRTKSTYLKPFYRRGLDNIVLAFSFTPEKFSTKYELGVAHFKKRIAALKKVVQFGWKIGIRLDPFVIYTGWEYDYKQLLKILFSIIPRDQIHSVTYGNIRYPKKVFTNIKKIYPEENLFLKFDNNKKNIYDEDNGELIDSFCKNHLFKYVDNSKIFCNIHEK